MATSPVPDMAAPPGMCPGVAVLGGGGAGGDGDGSGSGGKDGSGGGAGGDGDGTGGDGKNANGAPDYQKHPECGYASHPVDVVTGRAFTHPIVDLELPGPLPLEFSRMYSSKMADRDVGLGYGWGHTFGWELEVSRRKVRVWNEQGIAVDFPMIPAGGEIIGPWGWLLRRDAAGFRVDADDGVWREFAAAEEGGTRYRLVAIEDRNRNRIALRYEDGRLVDVKDSAGRIIKVVPTREGRIGSIQVQNAISQGRWIAFGTYVYDEHGNLVAATDADGFMARYEYDEEHRLTADTDRTGLCFHFVYDREGRCVESWGDYPGRVDPSLAEGLPTVLADGVTRVKGIHHCRFDYGAGGYSEVADSRRVRRFFGNKHGLLDKRVEGLGVVTCAYDDGGHIVGRTDELGATTLYERDARGRLTKLIDALGRTTLIDRDANGLPVRVVDPGGGVTQIHRDRFGNIEQQVDATGQATTYRRDARGLVTEIAAAEHMVTRLEYDAHGNLIATHWPGGGVTRMTYNALGRTLSATDPLGGASQYAYSERGDLISARDATGGTTRFAYDGEGHLAQLTRPSTHVRYLRWAGYHKLFEVIDEAGRTIKVTYDFDGFPVELRNATGETHRYEHNAHGLLIAETGFDGACTFYGHDLAGRVISATDTLGQKTEFVRNRCGVVTERHFPDGLVETIEADALGELVRATSGDTEIQIERDAVGRILRQTLTRAGEVHSVERSQHGARSMTTTSFDHRIVMEPGPDVRSRRYILGESHEVISTVDSCGREVERKLPGGGAIQDAYDQIGRLVERRVIAPSAPRSTASGEPEWVGERPDEASLHMRVRYDWDGRIIAAWDSRRGSTEYRMDPVAQLLAVARGAEAKETYAYDPNGNITGNLSESASYAAGDRLVAADTTRYVYDPVGRLVQKRSRDPGSPEEHVWTYVWNGAGRLTSAVSSDGTKVEFAYDALGRRVHKRTSRTPAEGGAAKLVSTTAFVWDGSAVIQEITKIARESGDPVIEVRSYWIAGDGFAALAHRDVRRDGDTVAESDWIHYVTDPNGTPERLINARGEVVGELERTALGRTKQRANSRSSTQLRFMGQYEDAETGLHYNHFRYYDPDTGRYLSPDPIGLDGGINLYRYVPDPNTMVDPFGLAGCQCVVLTNNGPPANKVATTDGSDLYAWRRNNGRPVPEGSHVEKSIPKELPAGSKTDKNTRGRCAEPKALNDYQQWLATQPNPNNTPMANQMQTGVKAIVPMNKGGGENAPGTPKALCDFCKGMVGDMGLQDKVMNPDAAAAATNADRSTLDVKSPL